MPQTAVLGMHAINDRPVVIKNAKGEKEIAIRPVMVVALTYDHVRLSPFFPRSLLIVKASSGWPRGGDVPCAHQATDRGSIRSVASLE